jgi:methyl-accepting chemotaxis protein
MSLRNIGIAPRAALGFGLVALLLFCIGAFSLMQMAKMDSAADEINLNWMPSLSTLKDINQSVLRQRIFTLRLLVLTDQAALTKNKANIAELKQHVGQLTDTYKGFIVGAEEQRLFETFTRAYSIYQNDQQQIIDFVDQGRLDNARDYLNTTLLTNADALMKTLMALGDFNNAGVSTAANITAEAYDS